MLISSGINIGGLGSQVHISNLEVLHLRDTSNSLRKFWLFSKK